ncbi:MAG: hypothetical protein RL358_435 [Pseudomonadota bacterium]|jgi:phospholipase/carboxylesterase
MSELMPHIALDSGENPQYSIIWLHGLGADGHDFVPMMDELKLPVAVRYIFPHANKIPVTINNGFVMRAWYDIKQSAIAAMPDEAGIRSSIKQIEAFIAAEMARGIQSEHIFVAGFSQGGAIALELGLRIATPLAGILALSTYLPLAKFATQEISPAAKLTPIFMAHGKHDEVVPYSLGDAARSQLAQLNCRLTWQEYAMQHSVCAAEIMDIQHWLSKKITAC